MPIPQIIVTKQPDALQRGVASTLTQANNLYQILANYLQTTGSFVWSNPGKKTPQEVVDAFGTNAADLFRLSGLLVDFLSAATNTKIPKPMPAGWTATPNADGTVILTPPES